MWFFLLIIFIFCAHGNQIPKIIQSPSDIYGLLNQQISLRCDSNDVSDKITWIKDNTLYNSNSNPLVIQLNHENEGQYHCNVSNAFGYILSDKFTVKIAYLHNFPESNNTKKYVSPATTVLLQCLAPDGLPKPKVEWKSSISINNPRFKLDSNNNLRIDNIQRSDAGFYWCEAKNLAFTRLSSSIELIISQKPIFQILPKHLQVMVASHILIPCHVIGDSPMYIQWYKLSSSKNDISLSRTILSSNCSMIIKNVRLEDSGAYVCRAKNTGGITEIIYKLSVISFPSFTETPENIKVKVGDSVYLRCSASGVPSPKVFWGHEKEYFLSDLDNSNRIIVFQNGTLSISSVRPRDSGKYFCFAGSFVGISRTQANLLVDTPFNMFPPIINKVPQNLTTVEGATVILTCQVTNSVFSVTWYKQSLRIIGDTSTRSRLQILKTGDLKIVNSKIQDSAVYTCRVTSNKYFSEKSAQLTVKSYSEVNNDYLLGKKNDIPTAPKNVSLEFVGDTYVLIKWEFTGDTQFLAFRVEVAEQYTNNWVDMLITRQKNALISNLKPDTGYMISVRTVNNNLIGDVCVIPDIIYTLEKPTISADISFAEFHKAFQEIEVFSVKLATISSKHVHLSWKVKGNSILRSISGFIIKAERVSIKRCLLMTEKSSQQVFSCLENEDAYNIEDHVNGYDDLLVADQNRIQKTIVKRVVSREKSRASAIIGGLKPFRCYEIKIETFIDHIKAGRISGRDSKTKTVLTFDDIPNKAPKIKNYRWIDNATFHLTWEPINPLYSNGPITGYVIQIIDLRKKSLQTYKIPVNILQFTYKIESNDHRYVLYLSADSCRGQGPRSWPVTIQYQEHLSFSSENILLQKPWIIATAFIFIAIITGPIIFIVCKKQKSSQQSPKTTQIPLVTSSNKEMEDSVTKMVDKQQHLKQMQSQKLLNNYETISSDFKSTQSDLFSMDIDPHSSTTTVPRFNCSSEDPNWCSKVDENRNDSLAYASSTIIYKGCQHYNLMNKFPPNFYGPFIDIDPSNAHIMLADSQVLGNTLIPPPPMYPPPPAPKNQNNFSDNNSEFILSHQGSVDNTHSSETTSGCGSNSNKSNKTRKSRTPQSINSSSSGSRSQHNRKVSKTSDLLNKDNSSPSTGGEKKKDSLSNSTHSSQQTGMVNFKRSVPLNPNGNKSRSRSQEMLTEIKGDTHSEQELTSELSESDGMGFELDENNRDNDSIQVRYKLPKKRPLTPDYSTDSSYPYSMANHYSSVEPPFQSYPNNLPTKF